MASLHTPNPDQASIVYIEHYLDVVESLPNNLARIMSRIHEVDIQRSKLANNLEEALNQYTQNPIADNEKHKLLNKFRSMLIQLQNLSDNKICLAQTMLDQIDIKSRQLDTQCRGASSTLTIAQSHSASTNNSNISNSVNSFANTNGNLTTAPAKTNCSTTNTTQQTNTANSVVTVAEASSTITNNNISIIANNTERTVSTPNPTSKDNGKELITPHSNGNGKRATRRIGPKKESNQDSNGGSGEEQRPASPVSAERTNSAKRVNKRGMKRAHSPKVKRRKNYTYNYNSRDSPTDSYADKVEPSEPTYCLCKQVSYGEMVCCDNTSCKIEWFHFTCVNLTGTPKGRWYCPNCRGDRSNILRK